MNIPLLAGPHTKLDNRQKNEGNKNNNLPK